MRRITLLLLLIFGLLTFAGSARADTVYSYAGNPYGLCVGTYAPSGVNNVCPQLYAMSLTFDTTLSGKQLDNLVLTSSVCNSPCIGTPLLSPTGGNLTAAISSFSFTDGSGFSITQANATGFSFDVTTDSKGNIQSWAIYAVINPPTGNGTYYQALTTESSDSTETVIETNGTLTQDPGLGIGQTFRSSSSPAQWTVTHVPEPSSLVLLGTGLLSLGVLDFWRRRCFPA